MKLFIKKQCLISSKINRFRVSIRFAGQENTGKVANNMKSKIDLLFSKKYLVYTNITLGGTFLGLGDLLEQFLNKKFFSVQNVEKNEIADKVKEKLKFDMAVDTTRTSAMVKTGLLFGGVGHYWYQFLDRKFPGTARLTILKKLACEMAAGPPWLFFTFLTVGYFENQQLSESIAKFKNSLLFLIIADWLFYVPLQSLNFKFVPPRYRFTYVVCLTVVYDVFLAFILHK